MTMTQILELIAVVFSTGIGYLIGHLLSRYR